MLVNTDTAHPMSDVGLVIIPMIMLITQCYGEFSKHCTKKPAFVCNLMTCILQGYSAPFNENRLMLICAFKRTPSCNF